VGIAEVESAQWFGDLKLLSVGASGSNRFLKVNKGCERTPKTTLSKLRMLPIDPRPSELWQQLRQIKQELLVFLRFPIFDQVIVIVFTVEVCEEEVTPGAARL
jgi:hypothetical protein